MAAYKDAGSGKGTIGTPAVGSSLSDALELRPMTVDDFSTIRYIHAQSFKLLAGSCFSEDELAAFETLVYSPQYSDRLRLENVITGWLGEEMVASASWIGTDGSDATARVRSVFVRPLFTGLGIGRRMVQELEQDARRSGYRAFGVRASINAVGFFETLGYEVSSHGIFPLSPEIALPVVFMRKDHAKQASAAEVA